MCAADPVKLQAVSHWFGEGSLRQQILFDVDLSIAAGEVVIVRGPSGSGKTTLLSLMGAMRAARAGSVCVIGRELRLADAPTRAAIRRQIGFVFQQHNLLSALNARENVSLPLELRPELSREEIREQADALLDDVGLGGRGDALPGTLSGGQRQRVAVARALANEPALVLADEPTASLDGATGRELTGLLLGLAKERGTAIAFVTHDERILDAGDRVLTLADGRIGSEPAA